MARRRDLVEILADHERQIRRMQATLARIGGGLTDHGALTGLTDDDHTQYLLKTGGTMAGDIDMDGNNILEVGEYTGEGDILLEQAAYRGKRTAVGTAGYRIQVSAGGALEIAFESVQGVTTASKFTLNATAAGLDVDLDMGGKEVINSPTAVRRMYRSVHSVSAVTAGSSQTLVIDISGAGFSATGNMFVNIIGSANNQYSYKSLYAYIALSTTSITVRVSGLESITTSGTSFFQVQIIEYYA